MNEEENIENKSTEKPGSTSSLEVNNKTPNVNEQPLNINNEPITNMEVHHPHHVTHKKKWSEYLLEFFMLFLPCF